LNVLSRGVKIIRIGILGCGSMGTQILKYVTDTMKDSVEVVLVADCVMGQPGERLAKQLGIKHTTDSSALSQCDLDLVVESASQDAVREHAEAILRSGTDLIVMSVGALVDPGLLARICDACQAGNSRLLIPSGAMGGLDVIKAANMGTLDEVILTSIKPPAALKVVHYIIENGIELSGISERTVIYEGTARDAVSKFPQNINVAAVLSLCGIGADRTMVRIVADPHGYANIHHVVARGAFGEMEITLKNLPNPSNPKTSYLAGLSALAMIRDYTEAIRVGT
jgi:aspartate dehydrogenase